MIGRPHFLPQQSHEKNCLLLWCVFICQTRLSFLVNDLSHKEHSYDFSLSCNSDCLVNESFLANPLWQIRQESGTWCVLACAICAFRWALLAKLFRHMSHVFNIDSSELTKWFFATFCLPFQLQDKVQFWYFNNMKMVFGKIKTELQYLM